MNYDKIEQAADALKHQKQCDPDGIMCEVSRQAVDETRENIRLLLDVALAAEETLRWLHPEAPGYIEEDLRNTLTALNEHCK